MIKIITQKRMHSSVGYLITYPIRVLITAPLWMIITWHVMLNII